MNRQPAKYARCPWCGRQPVKTKRGRITNHLTPGGLKCVGVGQPVTDLKRKPT